MSNLTLCFKKQSQTNHRTRNTSPWPEGLTKPEAAILVQMRSGKIGLGGYLKRIKVADTALC